MQGWYMTKGCIGVRVDRHQTPRLYPVSASPTWRTTQLREWRGGIVAIGRVHGIIRIVLVGEIERCVDTALRVGRWLSIAVS